MVVCFIGMPYLFSNRWQTKVLRRGRASGELVFGGDGGEECLVGRLTGEGQSQGRIWAYGLRRSASSRPRSPWPRHL